MKTLFISVLYYRETGAHCELTPIQIYKLQQIKEIAIIFLPLINKNLQDTSFK